MSMLWLNKAISYLLKQPEDFPSSEIIDAGYVFTHITLHGVGFSWACLPVGKTGDLGAFESILNEWAYCLLIDLFIVGMLVIGKIKVEGGFL